FVRGHAGPARRRTIPGDVRMTDFPDFRSPGFLRDHARSIMAFYHPHCLDPDGGCFQYFKDDGTIYDRGHRHLVSSTRFVFDYAMAARAFGDPAYLDATRHCLDYLRKVHRNPDTGGYPWARREGEPESTTHHGYGLAFVMVAYANARRAGIGAAAGWMHETWHLLERHFWDADAG